MVEYFPISQSTQPFPTIPFPGVQVRQFPFSELQVAQLSQGLQVVPIVLEYVLIPQVTQTLFEISFPGLHDLQDPILASQVAQIEGQA